MASNILSLCLLIVASLPPTVWANHNSATSIIELRESAEPAGTDHTGDIVSFTAVGSGAPGTSPRPWVCYTTPSDIDPTNVEWQTPDGVNIVRSDTTPANDGVAARSIGGPTPGIVLSRGTNYFSPDGDYCCVIADGERRCVTFTPCPTLPTLSNGGISYNPTTNVATYSCNTGYTLTGSVSSLTCNEGNRQWSSSERPTCETVTCPSLTDPDNGVLSVSGITPGSIASYSCTTGYVITPRDGGVRTCDANGEWTGNTPTCPPVECGLLTVTNGMVDTSSGTTFMNIATYTCDIGYTLLGDATRTCQSDGVWSSATPTCEILCPITGDTLANGMISYSDSRRPIVAGTVATYTCDTGYTLDGADTRTCVDSSFFSGWSSDVPACFIVDCGPLVNVANGRVDTSSGTTYQETATYTCFDGYQHIGAVTRTCQDNGQWSASKPTCEFILLSPGNTAYSNNTALSVSTILEASLSCHTELTTCCRDQDNPTGEALGDWVGPDGNSLPETSDEGFYVTRERSSVSLNLVESSSVLAGSYCCQVPRSAGGMSTHCIIVTVPLLPTDPVTITESTSNTASAFNTESSMQCTCTNDSAAIVLGVLLAISLVGCPVVFFFLGLKMKNINQTRYKVNFNAGFFNELFGREPAVNINTNNNEALPPQELIADSSNVQGNEEDIYEEMDPEEPFAATMEPETSECLAYVPSNMPQRQSSTESEAPPCPEVEPPDT